MDLRKAWQVGQFLGANQTRRGKWETEYSAEPLASAAGSSNPDSAFDNLA